MRIKRLVVVGVLLLAFSISGVARGLPACDVQVLTRNGNQISINLQALTAKLNQRLRSAHASFQNLQLTPQGENDLKISGQKDGNTIAISGPLQVTKGGKLQLHAKHISKNGSAEKGIMDLFGKDLSDYVNLQKTKSMSVQQDNLLVNTDKLLGLHGRLTGVQLQNETVELQFASQPCRSEPTPAQR